MSCPIIDHIYAALRAAGPSGLTARQIADAVSQSRGKATSQEAISATMSNRRTAGVQWPRLHLTIVARRRRWTLIDDGPDPAPLLPAAAIPPQPTRAVAWPSSVTAALMGDPLPGRSVRDQRTSTAGVDRAGASL